MGYSTPCEAPISDTWQEHRDRPRPSSEPGTDYACAYGTEIAAAGSGVVVDVHPWASGATGRYVTIDLDDGRRIRYLHLSTISVRAGKRVDRGQIIARSGASGWGREWGYGAHVHVTLWATQSYRYGRDATLDFENYLEAPSLEPTPTITVPEEDDDMKLITWNGRVWVVSDEKVAYVRNDQASLQVAKILTKQAAPVDLTNDQLTELLFIAAIPWAALDATFRGQAFDNMSNWGSGNVWSRQIAEGYEDELRDESLAQNIDDLIKITTK